MNRRFGIGLLIFVAIYSIPVGGILLSMEVLLHRYGIEAGPIDMLLRTGEKNPLLIGDREQEHDAYQCRRLGGKKDEADCIINAYQAADNVFTIQAINGTAFSWINLSKNLPRQYRVEVSKAGIAATERVLRDWDNQSNIALQYRMAFTILKTPCVMWPYYSITGSNPPLYGLVFRFDKIPLEDSIKSFEKYL